MEISSESLVNEYGHMVSSLCRRMVQDANLAQDAAQQVWLEVINSLQGFRGEAKISTWIYSIAHRVILDFARNERLYSTRFLRGYFREGNIEIPQEEDFNKETWVREMCDKCLTGMLHCLDNEARLDYILRDIVQLPYREIARIQKKDEQSVRKMVSRSRKKLKSFLNDECALANPNGTCHCRMKKWVEQINLPQEYEKLRAISSSVNLYLESETALPNKNFWETYL